VANLYLHLLDRSPDPSSSNFVSLLNSGATDQQVIALIVGNSGNEYFNKTIS
jgi:hypothetical protein